MMKRPVRLPPLDHHTVKLYWIGLSLAGIVLAWSFFYEWPPMTKADKIDCTAMLAAGCIISLYKGFQGIEWDRLTDWFHSTRAAMALGLPSPPPGSYLWSRYKAGACSVLMDAMGQFLFCTGCMKKMPWGWLLLLMHVVFTAGVGILKKQMPQWFDGSDPDLASTAFLTLPALDFTIAGITIVMAWFF